MMTRQHRILIVDDNTIVASFLARILRANGFAARTENRPLQVLSVAQAFQPDLILLDIVMPCADGGDIARELRSCPTTAGTPIIFCTSMVTPDDLGGVSGELAGEKYIAKPVTASSLVHVVRKSLASETSPAPIPARCEAVA